MLSVRSSLFLTLAATEVLYVIVKLALTRPYTFVVFAFASLC